MNHSQEYFNKALQYIPGGVHSPVRSFKGLKQTPLFVQKASGPYFITEDNEEYIDFCMSFGPLILGHTHPKVAEALNQQIERGWSYGACEKYSLELAQYIVDRIPFIDQIRFMSSGTEAVMTAIRLARGFTKKNKIIKFDGCYHGHVDSMLIKSGSGLANTHEGSSAGIPLGVIEDTLVCKLGDEEHLNLLFKKFAGQIAAVIIEPLPANYGLLIQENQFLLKLKKMTENNEALLIFDEVISGFRIEFGGMSSYLGINPDIVTYGKVIGGGMPVGAVAARREIMQKLAPVGDVYQAGTLSANPLSMCCGLATLKELTPAFYEKLNNQTANIVSIFEKYFTEKFPHYSIKSMGSLFWPIGQHKKISNLSDLPNNLSDDFSHLFSDLLSKKIYLAPNGYEVGFVSIAHDHNLAIELEKRLWT